MNDTYTLSDVAKLLDAELSKITDERIAAVTTEMLSEFDFASDATFLVAPAQGQLRGFVERARDVIPELLRYPPENPMEYLHRISEHFLDTWGGETKSNAARSITFLVCMKAGINPESTFDFSARGRLSAAELKQLTDWYSDAESFLDGACDILLTPAVRAVREFIGGKDLLHDGHRFSEKSEAIDD